MADFPTTPHTFTPFANGATSDAAQVTDIYNEVEAIEAGYLNGTARLNSSNSTVATLSVAGGSTFAGAVTLGAGIASTLSVTGSVTLSSQVYAPNQPRCMLTSTAALALAADVFTAVSFESEDFDVGGLHSTATNPSRITIPAGSSGLYLFGALVRASTGGAEQFLALRIVKNSTTEIGSADLKVRSSLAVITLAVSHPVVADGADFFTAEVSPTTSTGSLPVAATRRASQEFWCVKLW